MDIVRGGMCFLLFATASCGGGGGGGSTPPPTNNVPAFTSAATATVPENTSTSFYAGTATDVDGDTLTYAIVGGADASLLQITPAGALSFRAPPDFEARGSSAANNSYVVEIGVSDGKANVRLTVTVTVTDLTTGAFRVRRVLTGLAEANYVTGIPDGSGRILAIQRTGQIRVITPATGTIAAAPFLDVSGQISIDGERGLLGLALAPDFRTSGTAYVYLTDRAGNIELRRYRTFAGDMNRLDPATADVILKVPHAGSNLSYGGWIGFGQEGWLYVTIGDGADCDGALTVQTAPLCNARSSGGFLGSILRLDVSQDRFPGDPDRDYSYVSYGTGSSSTTNAFDEILFYGFRNPVRGSIDRLNGNFWFADRGVLAQEEVNFATNPIRFSQQRATAYYGWPYEEGYRRNVSDTGVRDGVAPLLAYFRGTGPLNGSAVTGGYVYRGPVESLQALYIFGDAMSGHIWSTPTSPATGVMSNRDAEFAPPAGTIDGAVSFGEDERGNLYIVDRDGELFVVEPA